MEEGDVAEAEDGARRPMVAITAQVKVTSESSVAVGGVAGQGHGQAEAGQVGHEQDRLESLAAAADVGLDVELGRDQPEDAPRTGPGWRRRPRAWRSRRGGGGAAWPASGTPSRSRDPL